jgi:hypothetical protein
LHNHGIKGDGKKPQRLMPAVEAAEKPKGQPFSVYYLNETCFIDVFDSRYQAGAQKMVKKLADFSFEYYFVVFQHPR